MFPRYRVKERENISTGMGHRQRMIGIPVNGTCKTSLTGFNTVSDTNDTNRSVKDRKHDKVHEITITSETKLPWMNE